ncbi:MAG: serine/threonine protein kinase [Ignavibacteriae bacterium]|nr:serine/threonine protein kinase [Ignavibacteriota bacterium]NOG99558.1 serine/threonine protein kinase [Ignavibacteriota bacterium]
MKNNFNEIVKNIFNETIDLSKDEREKYFASLPADQKKYVDEVKSLIDSFEKTDDFLEVSSDHKNIFSDDDNTPSPMIGKHIGHYLIEEEIGYGGMGIVFSGKRDDKEFDQKVAVKILKQGLTTNYLVKRFENERQTLANLQHPNIAKLFDGGKTDEGLPYLVMEYIDGSTITDYCSEKNLSITERLKLFVTVGNAVQYAHQNLVVHRDIKPGNILVNKAGRPKLLDFGVAKLLDANLEPGEDGLTKTGMWHLTPEYASPEQIKGEPVTTSSDIYSLGVLLYQILTGHQPYKFKSTSPLEISKTILTENILKPSEAIKNIDVLHQKSQVISETVKAENKKLAKQLKGDLDNIVLKTMHKDPAQRYISVQAFVDDINRYLKGLPVNARKDTVSYRASKFIQRHKVGFALFLIVNLMIIGSVAAIIHQANVAARERDNARVELKKFEEVNNFMLEMLASADPGIKGRDVKVYDLLEKATEDIEIKLRSFPKIKSAIKQTLGQTFIGLGEYEKAEALLLEALESNKKLFGPISKEAALSSHQLGLCYDWMGSYQLADSFYAAGISIYEQVSDEPLKGLADNLNDYGTLLTNTGEYDSASIMLKRSLEIYSIFNEVKGQKEAITINNLAVNMHHQNKIDEAENYYLEAKEILTNLYGENRPEVASIFNNLAFIYLDNKKFDESEKAFQKAYEIKLAVIGENHPSVGLALANMGMLNFVREEYEKAEPPLLKSIELFKRTNSNDDPFLSLSYYWLGRAYMELDRLSESETSLKNSIQIREKVYSSDHSKTWSSKGELAICLYKQKRFKESEMLLIGALNFFKNDKYKNITKIERYTEYASQLYSDIGDIQKSEKYSLELEKLNITEDTVRD